MRKHEQHHDMSDAERPRLDDHLYQEPQAHAYGKNPEDGLPSLQTPALKDTEAPPLSPDRFVCMRDARQLVDESGNVFFPDDAGVKEDGVGPFFERRRGFLPVERVRLQVIRPQCVHYKRQLVPMGADGEHQKMHRICTAAMNAQGEYYSLSDQEVLACEFRDPPDPRTTQQLDDFDRKAIEAHEAAQEKEDDFDPLQEMSGGGIFGS